MSDFKKNLENSSLETHGFDLDKDILAEQLLNNINTTPIGMLLKQIAVMPEIRQEKVSHVRGQLKRGHYDLNSRLEIALDKVLEELIS